VEEKEDSAPGPLEIVRDAGNLLSMTKTLNRIANRIREMQRAVDDKTRPFLSVAGPVDRNDKEVMCWGVSARASSMLPTLAPSEIPRTMPFDQVFAGAAEYASRCGRQQAFLQPYLGYGLYNSHGRFFTQHNVMLNVSQFLADKKLVGAGDHFIDFSASSNEFAPMLASTTGCTFQAFDLFPPKDRTNFQVSQKDWFSVTRDDACVEMRGKREIVLGLNPPFGNKNLQSRKFVTHGIKIFRPRLIVLIVPELGELQDYEVIHKDKDMVCGKQCFFIPGTANLTIKTDTQPAFIVYRRIDEKWLCASCGSLVLAEEIKCKCGWARSDSDWECASCGNRIFARRQSCHWRFPGGRVCGGLRCEGLPAGRRNFTYPIKDTRLGDKRK